MSKVVHKGKQGAFIHVSYLLCNFYGNKNVNFIWTDKNKDVTCKRCLAKLKKEKSK